MTGMVVPAALLAMAEAFAGEKLAIDERLRLPVCPALAMGWADGPGPAMIEVRCDVPAWRVFLPVATANAVPKTGPGLVRMDAPPEAERRFRRGELVTVTVRGAGFSVSLEAVAEGPARDGRLWVKTVGGDGRRLLGRLGPDGLLVIDGLSGAVNGR